LSEVLWKPSPDDIATAKVTEFARWMAAELGRPLEGYDKLWRWSVEDVPGFWEAIWRYYEFESATPYTSVLEGSMPEARWFAGASLNYAERVFAHETDARPAMIVCGEGEEPREISWSFLRGQVAGLAATLRSLGVKPGDRVVGYISNRPEALVALLASASIGAVWASCSPDFGLDGATVRFSQLKPKVLVGAGAYRFGGKRYERTKELAALTTSLDSLKATIVVDGETDGIPWEDAVATGGELTFERTPFEHPLWILFSSGTTGVPKGIVQSHGGIALEHTKALGLGLGLTPEDRLYFFSSTSWMVWNYLVGALLVGAAPVLYDGSPGFPDLIGNWRIAAATGATVAGMGAAYISACQRGDADPVAEVDLSALRIVVSTGSALPLSGWHWLAERLPRVRIDSSSGGTDVCSAFACGSPILPVHAGEIPGRALGVKAEVWDASGHPVLDEVGELVITEPMPSMPVHFWGDDDGRRYRESYFSTFPGIWRHGDWARITSRGTVVIEGRSDSTLNRAGVRMGSADIYGAVEAVAGVADSLVVGVELPDGEYYMPLFVVPAEGRELDEELEREIVAAIRSSLSPRHVPDELVEAPGMPYTRTGKKLEVPVKRLIQGGALDEVVDISTVVDPTAMEWFAAFAMKRRDRKADTVAR
jgi:acetoacetyl-CoA synthetase